MDKLAGKRPFGRPWCRRKDNSQMDFQEIWWGGGRGLDLSGLLRGQLAGSCERGNKPSGSIKFREFLD